jgi:hypothetical protein
MPRPVASAPPEAIRIEDEVWQEAFTHREPGRPRRLEAIAGGRTSPRPSAAPRVPRTEPTPAAPRTAAAPRQRRPTAVAAAIRDEGPAVFQAPGWQEGPSPGAIGGVPGRKTVTIRGHGAEHNLPWPDSSRRRPQRRAYERAGFQPDRVAMWAVLLGILLVVVAVASAHG